MLFFGWQGIAVFLGMVTVVVMALYAFVKSMGW
jgi:hypothetical protein